MVLTLQRMFDADARTAGGFARVVAWIDDFIFSAATVEAAMLARAIMLEYARFIGVDWEADKEQAPNTRATLLGAHIDTVNGTLSIPPDKAYSMLLLCQLLVRAAARAVRVPSGLLLKVVGKLSAATGVVTAGRCRLAALRAASRVPGLVLLPPEAASEAGWWARALSDRAAHLRLVPLGASATSSSMAHTSSDASGNSDGAFGLVVGRTVLHGRFTSAIPTTHVARRELTPIQLFVHLFAPVFRGLTVATRVDSTTVDTVINRGSSPVADIRSMMQQVADGCHAHSVALMSHWWPREVNAFADGLTHAASATAVADVCSERLRRAGVGRS
jgi:hypothetical protein